MSTKTQKLPKRSEAIMHQYQEKYIDCTHNTNYIQVKYAFMAPPPPDPLWIDVYPPNGWNSNCIASQVCKSKYPSTDHDEAVIQGEEALGKDSKGMFHFNPGQQGKTVHDYNPYAISRYRNFDIAKGKGTLARKTTPASERCAVCKYLHNCEDEYTDIPTQSGKVRVHQNHGTSEKEENISIAKYFAEKYGEEIDLIPNPNNEKSADTLNRSREIFQEYKVNSKPSKSAIDNELRKTATQSCNVVILIDSDVDFVTLARGIKGRVSQANIEEIILIKDGKDLTLSRNAILSKGFKIQQEDFS